MGGRGAPAVTAFLRPSFIFQGLARSGLLDSETRVGLELTQPLKDCVGSAHPERAIFVNSSTDLSAKFKAIATAVSMLRVSQ